jgi:hypothetical protein
MVRPISLKLRATEVNRHARETLARLDRIGKVDARIKTLEAERQRLVGRRATQLQARDDARYIYRLYCQYGDAPSVAERDKAAKQIRAAESFIRAFTVLIRLNADDLRRLATHRKALVAIGQWGRRR